MVVVYYKSMVAGMKAAANIKNLQPPPYKADLSVNMLSYSLTGFLSVGCAGLMLLEQYAMRRVHCVGDASPATGEYCWHHGQFVRNSTQSDKGLITIQQSWVLQVYMYFFIRAFFFIAPHLLWTLKFKNKVIALLQGTCDVINDLEESWVRYAETAEEEIAKAKMVDAGIEVQQRSKQEVKKQLAVQYAANIVVTHSVESMTQSRMSDYTPMLRFTGLRMAYDVVVHSVFLLVDISIMLTCSQFQGSDFYCQTPWNDANLRCMLPMLQIMKQVMLLSVLCCGFMWVVMVSHTIWLAVYLLREDTSTCFIESIPNTEETQWETPIDRRTYKLMSLYLMQNFVVLHPLDLLRTFVKSLERKGLAGEGFVKKVTSAPDTGSEEVRRRKLNPQLSLYDNDDEAGKPWLKPTAEA